MQNKKITGFSNHTNRIGKDFWHENKDLMRSILYRLISSNLIFIDVSQQIAIRAGDLRLKYDIPTADSLIATTSVVENVKHILTDDDHFESTKSLIKPIDLKAAMKLF